jgi:hypothetical protein
VNNSIVLSSTRIPLNNGCVLVVSHLPDNKKKNFKNLQRIFDGLDAEQSKALVLACKFSANLKILDPSSNTSS